MNFWKTFSILLFVLAIGAVEETFRIFTSQDEDIAGNRTSLIPMALVMTFLFVFRGNLLLEKK